MTTREWEELRISDIDREYERLREEECWYYKKMEEDYYKSLQP